MEPEQAANIIYDLSNFKEREAKLLLGAWDLFLSGTKDKKDQSRMEMDD